MPLKARKKPSACPPRSKTFFNCFTAKAAEWSGSPVAFLLAALLVIGWAATGRFFGFSETWQLVINTTTTIITFLMVFLIQSTQNRDTHLKLDELIRATKGAHNALMDIEELSEGELLALRDKYEDLAASARDSLTNGGSDSDIPEIDLSQPKS